MSIDRALNLYINADSPGGANAALNGASAAPLSEPIQVMHKDKFTVRLYFQQLATGLGATPTAVMFDSGTTIVLAARPASDLKTGDILFSISSWAEGPTGEGDTAAYYEGTLNLNTVELNAAMEAETLDALQASVDVEVRDAGNAERLTYRLDFQINRQVYDGQANPTTTAYSGSESVGIGVSQVTVDISDHALDAAPQAYVAVTKPNGSDDNIFVVGLVVTATEIVAYLSAAPSVTGYKLNWILAV